MCGRRREVRLLRVTYSDFYVCARWEWFRFLGVVRLLVSRACRAPARASVRLLIDFLCDTSRVEGTLRTGYLRPMNRVILASLLALSTMLVSRVDAQQGASSGARTEEAPPPAVVITTLPDESVGIYGYPSANQGPLHDELEEANQGIRNTRNALITTSALAAVGMIVGATAFGHCEFIYTSVNQPDELVCTQRGDALLAAGGTIFGLAAIGMITSGIMLGVRKGKRRRLSREIRSQQGAHLQWDTESGRLEF
jgi:hypothetical protein